MKILRLDAENVKRLVAVQITPEGDLVVIGGENAHGKSSTLDAIEWALGGRPSVKKPVRDGQESAHIVVDLGDYVVERKIRANGDTTLKVKTKDGVPCNSPQKILDALVGKLTFDPLRFLNLSKEDQLRYLENLAGIDFSDTLDAEARRIYDERRDLNRDLKDAEARLKNMPYYEEAPEEEVSAQEILKTLEAAREHNNERFVAHDELQDLDNDIKNLNTRILELEGLTTLRAEKQAARDALAVEYENMDPEEDVQAIAASIDTLEETNQKVRANQAEKKLSSDVAKMVVLSNKKTDRLEALAQEKRDIISKAEMPIKGLGLGEGVVLYNGIPLDQISSAEQLIVSASMGLAINPNLRVLLIRDGSLLDAAHLAALEKFAKEQNCQIWLERVGDGAECAVIIEDGMVKR